MPSWTKTRLLSRYDLEPVSSDFRVLGAFNHAAATFDNFVISLMRVAQQPGAERDSFQSLPRYESSAPVVDWLANDGWLEICHANRRPEVACDIGAYCSRAMLLDINDPARIAQVASQPLLEPNEPYEQHGFVPNVVFPGGIVHVDDRILVYYGAADESTAVAETAWHDLAGAFD